MSITAAENAGPGPYELQDPLWVKMSTITSGITKKRKKSDAKPQSQINKCLNEKRRRNQENSYIDELAELISATDMSSGKTDKCQILQRTVEQIRHFRNQESSNSHAIQQGEVSSSNSNILSNDQLCPFLLEALDGFILLVNTEGRVDYVTPNIAQYINYTKDDVLKKDIYNIIHHGDHHTFNSNLLPMSSLNWTSEPQSQTRNHVFNCRFLVKPPDDKDETMEEKQQRISKYESMQINSILLSNNADLETDVSESSDSPCLLCIARRIPSNEKPIGTPVEQFTIKLDTNWKIIGADLSWLSPVYNYLSKVKDNLIGKSIEELCHRHDLNTLQKHLTDTLQLGENTSDVYRLRVGSDKFLKIQTKSKFFKANAMNNDNDFMMATNSIIGDNDLIPIESGQLSNNKMCSGHPSNRCANNSNNNNGNNNNNVGGPLMPVAHLNGQVSGISARGMAVSHVATSSNSIAFNTGGTTGSGGGASSGNSDSCNPLTLSASGGNPFTVNHFSGNMDLESFDIFPSTTAWDSLDSSAGWVDRPESRASGQPNSRPSSQPAPTSPSPQGTFSNSAAVASHCSPLRPFSPTSVSTAHTFSNSYSFSPLQETTQTSTLNSNVATSISTNGGNVGGVSSNIATTIKRTEENSKSGCPTSNSAGTMDNATARTSSAVETQNNSTISTESGRLRNLLTMGPNASEDSQDNTDNDSNNSNRHRILKTLLNQQDEDDYHSEHKVRTSPSNMPKPSMEHKPSLGNNMLLQLLNEKNDDEDDTQDTRGGTKKRNEKLLLQLMKSDPDEERKISEQQLQQVQQIQQAQQNREDDPLLRSLGFRTTTPSPSQSSEHLALSSSSASQVGQKRPGEDGDLNVAVKRPVDGSHQVSSSGTSNASGSKLWEKNKMLASLLAKQPPQTTNVPTKLPASVISATPQDKLPRVKQQPQQQQQQQQQQSQQQQPWTGGNMQVGAGNAITTTASARPLQSQSRQLPRQSTNTYLSHILSQQQQRSQMGLTDSEFTSSAEYRQTSNDPTSWDNQSSDPDLSEILDQVIDFVPEQPSADTSPIANLLNPLIEDKNVMNEKMAISAIQKSLMLCETAVNPTSSTTMPGTPPAYSTALGTTPVTTSHSYQPPPMYPQPRMRFNQQGVRQPGQFTQQQQLQLQQRSKLIQQHQEQIKQDQMQLKQRLLQQQKQQQMVIPSNATATDQINSSIHNIDNLLNNTVAPPNVSLQRSSVPESQISPGYGGSVQIASGHRLAHSYSHPSTIPQHPIVNNNFNSGQQVSAPARLSPHSPVGMLPFPHPQPLSPRVTQGNYGNTPRLFNVNQVRPQQQVIAQQQLQQQQQRSMPSPGTPATARQSPFPTEAFPPPTSPTASQFTPGPNTGAPNPTAQYRLQRATSTPSATTQLPGGIASPRHYSGLSKEPLLSPSHSHTACPATPHNNQHNATNTQQHFSSQQHTPLLYQQHTTNTADMQNSQFCYDRSSVPLYPSGGEVQDQARSLPPGNPVNHQMGGNASTSEFVRQELRAIVGARTQQQQQQQRVPNNLQNNLSGQVSQDDLEALGLTFEMSSAGEAVVSDGPAKSWAIGSAGSAPSSSRTTMEEVARGDPKSSLLQKLLSE